MAKERTLGIVKPDAVAKRVVGRILARIEEEGFRIVALRMRHLSRREAEGFYAVHRERPFFGDLTAFMSSGPCVAMVLEADDAIRRWRDTMGKTDPAQAAEGTLRRQFGTNIERNATHGSDASDTAAFEIGYFFGGIELD
jgi:nucleoside-diphosphate kinase